MQRLAIVGSGPAGFYTAARLLGRLPERLAIDMFEKYPIPHGLVRYGVAPDHPEVKSVINRFDEVASHPNFRYFGNVSIGQDLSLTELRRLYDRVVLAYGASQDKLLGLTGEETTRGALSAREFVAWYNGHPDFQKLSVDLTGTDTAVIIGQGNVALDVARVLLSPLDKLAKTDITENALEHLCRSKIRHVRVVGRRGPAQMQFTTKELREMFRIPGLQLAVDRDLVTRELNRAKHHIVKQRPLKRMTDLLYKQIDIALPSRDAKVQGDNKTWTLDFLQSPRELIRNPLDHPLDSFTHILRGIILEHNQLVGPVDNPKAEGTGVVETVETGLMLRSIGYRSLPLDPTLPFDTCQCIIPNISGRILTPKRISSTYVVDNTTDASTDTVFPGMYVSGWLKRGPSGIIVTTMSDAFETADSILQDTETNQPTCRTASNTSSSSLVTELNGEVLDKSGAADVFERLTERGVQVVTYADWKKLEALEYAQGVTYGKPREKVTDVAKMLDLIRNT